MNNQEIYSILGFVKISAYRTKTLKAIGDEFKMPSEISAELNLKTSQISTALMDLKNKNLVVCINEDVRKGRLYKCTDLGKEVLKLL